MFKATLGPTQHPEDLTVFPILAEKDREMLHLLMAEALSGEIITIGEKRWGSVSVRVATNWGDQHVPVLDAERLVGARQNRMTNPSIPLPPESVGDPTDPATIPPPIPHPAAPGRQQRPTGRPQSHHGARRREPAPLSLPRALSPPRRWRHPV